MSFIVAIPARFGSSRLPGKPLRLLVGEPIIRHVVRRAQESGAAQIVLATDDQRIADAVSDMQVTICMTASEHRTGTDRLSECRTLLNWQDQQIIVNLQGDEPFAHASDIQALAATLSTSSAPMATLASKLMHADDFFNPNCVKLVRDAKGNAIYFSRAPIPWARDRFQHDRTKPPSSALRHIGMYAYRAGFLRDYAQLAEGALERVECLEQLRVLEAGYTIAVAISNNQSIPGIDTEADLAAAEQYFHESGY